MTHAVPHAETSTDTRPRQRSTEVNGILAAAREADVPGPMPGSGVTEAGVPAVVCRPGPAAEPLSGTELTQADRIPGGAAGMSGGPGALGQLSDHESYDRHHVGIVDQIDLPTAFTARSDETDQL